MGGGYGFFGGVGGWYGGVVVCVVYNDFVMKVFWMGGFNGND